MKTVLFFATSQRTPSRLRLEGIYAYGVQQGWNILTIEHGVSEHKAVALLKLWMPDGVIVDCGAEQAPLPLHIFENTPVVFIDRPSNDSEGSAFTVMHDSAASARLAARELIALKLKSYAYVANPTPLFWCAEREKGFAEVLQLHNLGYSRFSPKAKTSDTLTLHKDLAAWLGDLPKPVGIFAANDYMAAHVAAAAHLAKLSIPDDAALIGVDNDESLCENTVPTLSSVMPDFRTAGKMAATMLDHLMHNRKPRLQTEKYLPLQIVRRSSSNRSKRVDTSVLAALDLIRRESCNGLMAKDVAACFPCSRRMAEIRFRTATGQSPLQAIQEVRLAKARELMSDPTRNRGTIANLCGYASATALTNFLSKKRRHGMIFAATSDDTFIPPAAKK